MGYPTDFVNAQKLDFVCRKKRVLWVAFSRKRVDFCAPRRGPIFLQVFISGGLNSFVSQVLILRDFSSTSPRARFKRDPSLRFVAQDDDAGRIVNFLPRIDKTVMPTLLCDNRPQVRAGPAPASRWVAPRKFDFVSREKHHSFDAAKLIRG
jgi:hypothetical protein